MNYQKMLDPSVIDLYEYNPLLNYIDGEDLSEDIDINLLVGRSNYFRYYVKSVGMDLINKQFDVEDYEFIPMDMTKYISKVEQVSIRLSKSDLVNFKKLEITEDSLSIEDHISGKSRDVIYYSEFDVLFLPKKIFDLLNKVDYLEMICYVYDSELIHRNKNIFNVSNNLEIPKLNILGISNNIRWYKLRDRLINIRNLPKIDKNFSVINFYCNLPKELYNHIKIPYESFYYDFTDKLFYGSKHITEVGLNFACKYNSVNNPIEIPVLLVTSDGYLIPMYSDRVLYSYLYLNLPSIPVCIISCSKELGKYYKVNNSINKLDLFEFLKPELIIK